MSLRAHSIKAIPTRFNGNNFRSRIEARWSIFFNEIGIEYEYEPAPYRLEGGVWYLPDFWIPYLQSFIEIKGGKPTREEVWKAKQLAILTRRPVYIFWGHFGVPSRQYVRNATDSAYIYRPYIQRGKIKVVSDYAHWWCECSYCHTISIQFEGATNEICDCFKYNYLYTAEGHATQRLVMAYMEANRAKF
jgi:hypothetical protein